MWEEMLILPWLQMMVSDMHLLLYTILIRTIFGLFDVRLEIVPLGQSLKMWIKVLVKMQTLGPIFQ